MNRTNWLLTTVALLVASSTAGAEDYVDGLIARLGGKQAGFFVVSFDFSPDGATLALGCDDGVIRFWDIARREMTRTIDVGDDMYIGGVAFAPDGKRLAFQSDADPVRLVELASGKEVARCTAEIFTAETLLFLPDNRRVIFVDDEWDAYVWDTETGELRKSDQPVRTAALSPEGNLAAYGLNTLRLVDPATGGTLREMQSVEGHVAGIDFSPDGKHVIATDQSCRGSKLRIWDVQTGEEKRVIELGQGTSHATAVAYLPDGATAVSSDERGTIKFWDLADGREAKALAKLPNGLNRIAVFSPMMVAGSVDGAEATVWDLRMTIVR